MRAHPRSRTADDQGHDQSLYRWTAARCGASNALCRTASIRLSAAIVGGGLQVRPGEISLAHHGVLFLDEQPQFDRRVRESVRERLETGAITIARATAAAGPIPAHRRHESVPLRLSRRCCAGPPLRPGPLSSATARISARLLARSAEHLALSGRGIYRLLALGRTIADLAASETIEPPRLAEAVQLRRPLASRDYLAAYIKSSNIGALALPHGY